MLFLHIRMDMPASIAAPLCTEIPESGWLLLELFWFPCGDVQNVGCAIAVGVGSAVQWLYRSG